MTEMSCKEYSHKYNTLINQMWDLSSKMIGQCQGEFRCNDIEGYNSFEKKKTTPTSKKWLVLIHHYYLKPH